MTEAQWLACTKLSLTVHDFVNRGQGYRQGLGHRKWWLFNVACCREVWHLLSDWRCRRAVEVAERYADGEASEAELAVARAAVESRGKSTAGALARAIASDNYIGCSFLARDLWARHAGVDSRAETALAQAEARQVALFRDIVGNPFYPATVDPAWLGWNDGCVVKIAQAIYNERRFGDMPILADALLDAGCDDEDILAHCRSEGPHARGCWLVDLLLGKS